MLDLRALVGDPSDNIPGVKGIGAKGAAKLIAEWETLENLIEHRAEIAPARARNALESQVEQARLSKRLSTLRTDVPLPAELEQSGIEPPDREALRELYERFGFVRLIDALNAEDGGAGVSASETEVAVALVEDVAALDAIVAELRELPMIPLICALGEHAPMAGEVLGVAVALGPERAAFLAVGEGTDGLSMAEIIERLRPVLEGSGAVAWIARDAKQIQIVFGERGLDLPTPYFDVGIAGGLLDPAGANALHALALRELDRKIRSWEDLAGRGAKAQPARELSVADVATWAADEVCALWALQAPLAERLDRDGLATLCDDVELPLTGVLARMERAGVCVDEGLLAKLSEEWGQQLEGIEADIYRLAGERFLVSSPKQLQKILFEKLKLEPIKKTKTGY